MNSSDDKRYNFKEVEEKLYSYWLKNRFFESTPDNREPYTIVIPPPNVTGVLHMGHMLNNTIQDVLIRYARMHGKNVCWVPGIDHASIATEAKVVAKLKAEGIEKSQLSREEFLKHAWEWKEKHGGIILEQLKKLGASCDWNRTCFTMDPHYTESVIKVFVDLYNKGYIYRGIRIVNWDPQAKTALSDEEVIYKQEQSNLYYVKYYLEDSDEYIPVATTRPETILADTALCVNPADERYKKYHNKRVRIPLVERLVPVITDEYVDTTFGTGALKVTPAHDANDYELGLKHNLEIIDILNDDGTLNEKAQFFVGQDRFVARKLMVEELKLRGLLIKIETYVNNVGYSERTNVVIEPRISVQWFLRMKELAKPAIDNFLNGEIKIIPSKFHSTYLHWLENIKDWCISRQLWWGHRIPAWYLYNNPDEFVVAETEAEALKLARKKYPQITLSDMHQDEDVLDTWFSSWLWPIAVFDGIRNPDNPEFKYYYPTNDLVTAPEILFFWVARMIIAGYEFVKQKPFHNVYLTGIVRDKLGRKMSKSLGNSPEPLDLIDKYGADGVRVGMLLCSPAGNDLLFDETLPEQGRNFSNKIWNAFRLFKQFIKDEDLSQPAYAKQAVRWFEQCLNKAIINVRDDFSKYRLSEALMEIYRLFWEDFASWYLEIIKPATGKNIDNETYVKTKFFFEQILKLLHPFMPFITEELWHQIETRKEGDTIMRTLYPQAESYDANIISLMQQVKELIGEIRNIRKQKNIQSKDSIELYVKTDSYKLNEFASVICKLANVSDIKFGKPEETSIPFLVGTDEYFIPFKENIDLEEEVSKIQKEIQYYEGFLASVMKKLSNEQFVNKAPKNVVENELSKKRDAEAKLNSLYEQLKSLKELNKA